MTRHVYSFGDGQADGHRGLRDLLGGKGANLAEMTSLGVPVPPGFTITTEVCNHYRTHAGTYPDDLTEEVTKALARLERTLGRVFGDAGNPLLVSVRSGAPISMPGMMDTVLNLGLNDATVRGLIERTGNPRFAYDSYRRFVAMYADVVMGIKAGAGEQIDPFETLLAAKKRERGVTSDHDLPAEDLAELVTSFKNTIESRLGQPFPEDPREQLWGAIGAVFRSWNNERAIEYRRLERIPDDLGTAVNVQAMVFGNTGDSSGTGVAFTRDPQTGENRFYGDFLINAQGEDVVAGLRTPQPISALQEKAPDAYAALQDIYKKLERHYRDMLDLEFTIEEGRLWMLQARVGKRFGAAALRIAVEMVDEGLIDRRQALERVDPEQLNHVLQPVFDTREKDRAIEAGRLLATGISAGPGAASGRAVFTAPDAVAWARRGEPVILVRIVTSPEDIAGMVAARGILTAQGGKTSHAALVARQMGRVCVVGCGDLAIDYDASLARAGGRTIQSGDWLSIDGTTGEVIEGRLETNPSEVVQVLLQGERRAEDSAAYQRYARLMEWADAERRLRVRANADQPDQAQQAIAFGAEGIGLCRTEHMFFGADRIRKVRQMILAESAADRQAVLAELLPVQRRDFEEIFRVMAGKPVTIRLLDPPLHEFLPHGDEEIAELARVMGHPETQVRQRIAGLSEANPMLGHRGCRLGVTSPEVYEMQVRAIIEAACTVAAQQIDVRPEIMIPLVSEGGEMRVMRELTVRVAEEVLGARRSSVTYQVGTMIELPRACLVADTIAEHAEFFSFGTNDLTQTTYGLSRDDAGSFLPDYLNRGLYAVDPFVSIDRRGMGQLMEMAAHRGRQTRAHIKIGICGEHGGDPTSVTFCNELGLDYVSCSPYRVPIARLAAAQAALQDTEVLESVEVV